MKILIDMNLSPQSAAAQCFASFNIPSVFDRHPKAKDKAQYQQETAAMTAEACTRIGLPQPREAHGRSQGKS